MPLIIITLAVIVIFLVFKDTIASEKDRKIFTNEVLRKTNAFLEQRLVDKHMKEGCSLAEAYDLTVQEIISKGYDPCVPKSAYLRDKLPGGFGGLRQPNRETSKVNYLAEYNSKSVQQRIEIARLKHALLNPYEERGTYEPTEFEVYYNFPTTMFEYDHERVYVLASLRRAKPIGSMIMVNDVEHEVVGLDLDNLRYKLKNLRTMEITDRHHI